MTFTNYSENLKPPSNACRFFTLFQSNGHTFGNNNYTYYSMFKEAINNYLHPHGYKVINLKAVLFDMDGVLFDSMTNHATSGMSNEALRT